MKQKETARLTIKDPLSPVYVFFGEQEYLIEYMRRQVITKALPEGTDDFNISHFDMEEEPVEVALEDAETLPFMGDKKVVIIQNPYFFTGQTKTPKVEHDLSQLEAYLENPALDSIIIFCAPYQKFDSRKKLVKQLNKSAEMFDLNSLEDRRLFDLLASVAESLGAEYSEEAHQALVSRLGTDIQLLVGEVKKMALFCGEGGQVTSDVVYALSPKSLESNVFDLVNFVMKHEAGRAFGLLEDLLKQKEEPVRLAALLARQFRIALQVKLYEKQGYTRQQIAKRIGVHPYGVKIAGEQAETYPVKALEQALKLTADADYRMKTGRGDKVLILQLLIDEYIHL